MRFSRRVPELRLNAYSSALARLRREGAALVDLTGSNPTDAGIDFADEARLAAAFDDPRAPRYEPEARGPVRAREAIASAFAPRFAAERLTLTASTSEAYALLFKLLADPGERVLLPRPSYPLLEHLARLEGLEVGFYGVRFAGRWELDLAELEAGLPGARVVVVVNPNNPTGDVLDEHLVARLGVSCRAHGAALISDEVFYEYRRGAGGFSLSGFEGCLSFTLGGLSKACALPQLKLAWIDVGGPPNAREETLEALEMVADTYLSVSAPVARAAPALLALGRARRAKVDQRARASLAAVGEVMERFPAVSLLPSDGGWSAVLRLPALEDEEALALRVLEEERVMVHPGYFFDMVGGSHWVVSLLTPPARIREGLARALARV